MSETTLQKVEAEVQKLTAELESLERAQVRSAYADCGMCAGGGVAAAWWLLNIAGRLRKP